MSLRFRSRQRCPYTKLVSLSKNIEFGKSQSKTYKYSLKFFHLLHDK